MLFLLAKAGKLLGKTLSVAAWLAIKKREAVRLNKPL
jgi:hypothetical protein